MKIRIYIGVVLFLLSFNVAFSQWVQTKGPIGGHAEFLLRADNGNSWFSSNKGLITSDKVFTAIGSLKKGLTGKLYISASFVNEVRVFVSSDNGSSWTKLKDQIWGGGPTTETPNGTLWANLGREVAKSVDGGNTWTFPTLNGLPNQNIRDMVVLSNDEFYIVLSENNGIYKSTDAGNNWKKLNTQTLFALGVMLFHNDGVLYCLTGTILQISRDKGETWTTVIPSGIIEPKAIAAADNGDIFVTGRVSGLLKSTDKGATWNSFFTGLEITGINSSIVTTKNSEVIVNQLGFGLFKSPQAAPNFMVSHNGFFASNVNNFFEGKSGKFYATTDGSTFMSNDSGASWTKIHGYSGMHSSVCEKDNYIFVGVNDGVMRSSNGGSTWAYVRSGFVIGTQQYVHQLVVTSKGTILAATGGGMYRTTNNGDAWTKLTSFGNNSMIKSIIQKPNGDLYASSELKFYKSTDDGATWSSFLLGKLNNPATNLDGVIDVINHISDTKNNLYINFGGNFYIKSSDNGVNWEKVSLPRSENVKSILFGANDSLFVTTAFSVFVSTDFGATHTDFSGGLISRMLTSMHKTSGGNLFVLSNGSGVFKRGKAITSIKVNEEKLPTVFNLEQNYPNPFNPETTITYSITKPSNISLKVYDVLGNEIATLVNEFQQAGRYSSSFNTQRSSLTSGVYIYTLRTGSFISTKKMLLIR